MPLPGRRPKNPPARLGRVTPCCLRHATNLVRVAEAEAADPEAAALDDELDELLPHAASRQQASTQARGSVNFLWAVMKLVLSCFGAPLIPRRRRTRRAS